MQVYIVIKNDKPCGVTLKRREAYALYDDIVRSGQYRQAAVRAIAAGDDEQEVVFEAYQAQDAKCHGSLLRPLLYRV